MKLVLRLVQLFVFAGQWNKLLDMADEIRAYIKENEPKLKAKE